MKIKKALSIILVAVITMMSCVVSSYALNFEADYEIQTGETITVSAPMYDGENYAFVKFVPQKSGTYSLKSESKYTDPVCDLLDNSGEYLYYSDDSYDGENYNFTMIYAFEAGETYWFALADYEEAASWSISLEVATHTTANGSIHAVEYIDYLEPTCTEEGYTEGLYCAECEKYVYGHEELEPCHIDWDFDGVCDECLTDFCSCTCHSDSLIMRIIWTVINLFHRIIGLVHFCECGMIF